MARPERNDVDYFPFLCKEGKSMYYIENKYGNDGYATWVKLLRQLATTNYHYLNLSNEADLMFLASKCKISEEKLQEIINDLCKLGEFNRLLWDGYRIIFSEKFIDNIQDAYSRRNNKCINYDGLCKHLLSLGITITELKSKKTDNNPHSIVEYSKEKNTILYSAEDEKLLQAKYEPDFWRPAVAGFLNDVSFKKSFCKAKGIDFPNLEKRMNDFVINLNLKMDYKDLAGLKSHFTNHYNKHVERVSAESVEKNSGSLSMGFVEVPKNFDYEGDNHDVW